MKKSTLLSLLFTFAAVVLSDAAPLTYTYSSPVYSPAEGLVPDNGVSSFDLGLNSPITAITDLNVHLIIEGGFSGDLTALLLLGSDPSSPFSILLDGITGQTSGLDIWLDDQATGNVHDVGGAGSLSGTFKPNGPEALSMFNGLVPSSDTWNLLISDNSPGLESTLLQWELQITGNVPTTVPESVPAIASVALFGLIAAHESLRRRQLRFRAVQDA